MHARFDPDPVSVRELEPESEPELGPKLDRIADCIEARDARPSYCNTQNSSLDGKDTM